MTVTPTEGRVYADAARFAADLERNVTAAQTQMLAAWSDAYWQIRDDMDRLAARVEAARRDGTRVSPAWLYQEQRYRTLLAQTQRSLTQYADAATTATTREQARALADAQANATALVQDAAASAGATFLRTNPAVVDALAGVMANGGALQTYLRSRIPGEAVDGIRAALTRGVATGKGIDWMVREVTRSTALAHTRAVTILRTETHRVYREATRATYRANADVLDGWVWTSALDRRTCPACVAMHGTLMPLDERLDGHPRCRCAMVPQPKAPGALLDDPSLPDTRPPIETGEAWYAAQPPDVQRAIVGPLKYDAMQAGELSLADVVGRRSSDTFGTMRYERSLLAIREGRDPNTLPDRAPDATRAPAPTPDVTTLQNASSVDVQRAIRNGVPGAQAEVERRVRAFLGTNPARERVTRGLADYEPGGMLENAAAAALLREYLDASVYRPAWPLLSGGPDAWGNAMREVNPGYATGEKRWQNNCTNCAVAWELRRRGYDVRAQSRSKGRSFTDTFAAWGKSPQRATILQAEKAIKALGEGARGAMVVEWRKGGGHIFNWEVIGGEVRWIDSQPGREHTTAALRLTAKPHAYWFRTDDAELTPAMDDHLLGFSTDPT